MALAECVQPDHGQTPSVTGERPGFRRLVIFRGRDTFVPHESRPEYFRKVTPRHDAVEITSPTHTPTHIEILQRKPSA